MMLSSTVLLTACAIQAVWAAPSCRPVENEDTGTVNDGSVPVNPHFTNDTGSWGSWNGSVPSDPPYSNGTLPGTLPGSQGNGSSLISRWLHKDEKVRGVNLGSQFIVEPWMAWDEWQSMGCGQAGDEWNCVKNLGQAEANAAFEKHWQTWITEADLDDIVGYNLNTIRIPVGFWIFENLVQPNESYPQGGLKYLDQMVGWASDRGLYIIMDLHGGPGSQSISQSFTGHGVSDPQFYNMENYQRATDFLTNMTERIHTNEAYRNVGMLMVMNEPVHTSENANYTQSIRQIYYPLAFNGIRGVEQSLGVPPSKQVDIQFMSTTWGAGDPTEYLPNTRFVAVSDHNYYAYGGFEQTQEALINYACTTDRSGPAGIPSVTDEWSLSVQYPDDPQLTLNQTAFYQRWWAAQALAYEKTDGWVFWSYKTNWLNGREDFRWSYQYAVQNGVIPKDAATAASLDPCSNRNSTSTLRSRSSHSKAHLRHGPLRHH